MKRFIELALSRAERLFLYAAGIALLAMMLAVSADALGRYVFGRPLQGSYEFTALYLMVFLAFMGLGPTHANGGQIRIDILGNLLRRAKWYLFARLNALLAALVFALAAYFATGIAIEKFANNEVTFGLIAFPMYWSYVWFPVGMWLLVLRLLYEVAYPPEFQQGGAH